MIEPTKDDIGRRVVYTGDHLKGVEEGVITSFNDNYVFVRYDANHHINGTATYRRNLEWAD